MAAQPQGKIAGVNRHAGGMLPGAMILGGGQAQPAYFGSLGKAVVGGDGHALGQIPGICPAQGQGTACTGPLGAVRIQAEDPILVAGDGAAQGGPGPGERCACRIGAAAFRQGLGIQGVAALE